MTNGFPCKDCGCKPCRLEKVLAKIKATPQPTLNLKTNKELASEHGITKRQVAKRRITGTDQLTPEVVTA